jgi:alpha-amylase
MKDLLRGLFISLMACCMTVNASAQGWPENYKGVMLQGFYWDSFSATQWTNLKSQAQELGQYFDLVWLPQSGNCGGGSNMGYSDLYWFPGSNHYTSSFGTEAELRDLITTFKNNGIGTIADVVINHRKSNSGWFGFPSETYNGTTYSMSSTDVCSDDDNGKAMTQANSLGVSLGSKDTGEGWDGMRDLDHTSTNVQTVVKAYLKMLLNDLGYAGFRYDMVKGYAGSYTGIYNEDSNPTYSVGEYWDGNATSVKNWINATKRNDKVMSAAFDFPFRYTVRNALRGSTSDGNSQNWKQDPDYRLLATASVASDANYRRYAVTFVENHDTEYRSADYQQDPIRKDTLAANAYLLAMPGTPCVFLKHWLEYKQDIKAMIDVRKAAGIHNMSAPITMATSKNYYAVLTDQKLLAVVGPEATTYTPTNQNYKKVLEGYHYAYYLNKSMETAWVDKASGTYNNNVEVMLTAVSANDVAQLVYTTDGSNPTASSTKVASGTKINIGKGNTTLKVGLLIGSTVSGIVTRTYNVQGAQTITVYVNTDAAAWTGNYVNYHSWGDGIVGTSWPGDKVTDTKTIDGKTWYYKDYTVTATANSINFVFSAGSGSPQSVDVNNVTKTSFFEVTAEKDGSKYKVKDVTATGIQAITTQHPTPNSQYWYTLSGQRISKPTQQGIYIHNGKKVVIK